MNILTVNVGSSSVRLAVYDRHTARCTASTHVHGHEPDASQQLAQFVADQQLLDIAAIGHRIVHGGDTFQAATHIDAHVEAELATLAALAPLHNPRALAWVRACRAQFGTTVPQIAVFDTAFFSSLPAVSRTYAIPHALAEQHGLHRYGFHGLAHRAMCQQWRALSESSATQARVISLQLGSGCSMAAIRDGHPIDTSMGYSPLEGLMMATRPGDVDAGLLLALQTQGGFSATQLQELLNEKSGLLGVSGASSDIRVLLAAQDEQAQLAAAMYCYRARKYLGAYLAALGGADAILIGGGVGEHLPEVRSRILQDMQWAGITLDPTLNNAAIGVPARIDAEGSKIAIHVLPVDEAQIVFEEVSQLMKV